MFNYDDHYRVLGELYLRKTQLNIVMPYIRIILTSKKDEDNKHKMETQQSILKHTSEHPLLKKYPIALKYQQQFLVHLIRLFEEFYLSKTNDNFHYPIYELYTDLLLPRVIDTSVYVTETIHSNHEMISRLGKVLNSDVSLGFVTHRTRGLISVLETNQIVSEGTTGFRTWPAALHLADYLLLDYKEITTNDDRKEVVFDRLKKDFCGWSNVLELGAGSGLLGISLLKCDFFRHHMDKYHYEFTDHNDAVIERIKLNLLANGLLESAENSHVSALDWCNMTQQNDLKDNYDLILASDVVFDPELVDDLAKVISRFMYYSRDVDSARRPPDCLVCCAERNITLLDHFTKQLQLNGLKGKVISTRERPSWAQRLCDSVKELNKNMNQITGLSLETLDADSVRTRIYRITIAD